MAVWLGFPTGTQLGGKIIFPKNHDIGIEAIQGSALFWYSKFKNGFDDERTQFARCPIIQGILIFQFNGSQLKNPDICGAIFKLSILILNSQCVEGARDVRVL